MNQLLEGGFFFALPTKNCSNQVRFISVVPPSHRRTYRVLPSFFFLFGLVLVFTSNLPICPTPFTGSKGIVVPYFSFHFENTMNCTRNSMAVAVIDSRWKAFADYCESNSQSSANEAMRRQMDVDGNFNWKSRFGANGKIEANELDLKKKMQSNDKPTGSCVPKVPAQVSIGLHRVASGSVPGCDGKGKAGQNGDVGCAVRRSAGRRPLDRRKLGSEKKKPTKKRGNRRKLGNDSPPNPIAPESTRKNPTNTVAIESSRHGKRKKKNGRNFLESTRNNGRGGGARVRFGDPRSGGWRVGGAGPGSAGRRLGAGGRGGRSLGRFDPAGQRGASAGRGRPATRSAPSTSVAGRLQQALASRNGTSLSLSLSLSLFLSLSLSLSVCVCVCVCVCFAYRPRVCAFTTSFFLSIIVSSQWLVRARAGDSVAQCHFSFRLFGWLVVFFFSFFFFGYCDEHVIHVDRRPTSVLACVCVCASASVPVSVFVFFSFPIPRLSFVFCDHRRRTTRSPHALR